MTPPPLEDRLNRLADGLIAPPTSEAREAIGHRTGVLRRRRRARQAVGAGVLVLAAVAGTIAITRDATPDASSGYAGTDAGALPAIGFALDGWQVVTAEDTAAGASVAPNDGSVQVFQLAGEPEGPKIVLRHSSASDPVVPRDRADEEVGVGGVVGYLRSSGPDSFTLRWTPPLGDNAAEIEADGLTRDEVLAFAVGLQGKDDDPLEFPASADDRFGFVATEVPEGMVEVPSPEAAMEDAPARRLVAMKTSGSTDATTVELTIEATGDASYDALVNELAEAGTVEDVSVMGRPAVLVEHQGDRNWSLAWRPRSGTTARMVVSGVDRAGLDGILSGLQEIDEDEWDALVATHAGP
jgi:hypothetical protein